MYCMRKQINTFSVRWDFILVLQSKMKIPWRGGSKFNLYVCLVSLFSSCYEISSTSLSNASPVNASTSSRYIEWREETVETETFSTPTSRRFHNIFGTSSFDHYQGDQNLCPQHTFCGKLSSCPLLTDLMERSCLIPSRLKELACGYQGNNLMVCCPNGGSSSPFRHNPGSDVDQDVDPDGGKQGQLNQACGKPQLNGWQSGYSGLGSHPWGVRVGFRNADTGATEYPCGGSLITSTVVLTAAHCAVAKAPGRAISVVRVGEYDMRSDPDCTNTFCAHPVQIIAVASVVVHPAYEKSTFRNDIALIILKSPANFSLGAQPICILQSQINLVGSRATLLGFGKLPDQDCEENEDTASSVQHQVQLPVVSNDVCARIYDNVIKITANHMCVGGEPKKDACSGFGGSPLVLLDPYQKDRYVQIGIVSFGSDKCGAAGVPSVYSNVYTYYTWIKANMP